MSGNSLQRQAGRKKIQILLWIFFTLNDQPESGRSVQGLAEGCTQVKITELFKEYISASESPILDLYWLHLPLTTLTEMTWEEMRFMNPKMVSLNQETGCLQLRLGLTPQLKTRRLTGDSQFELGHISKPIKDLNAKAAELMFKRGWTFWYVSD